MAKFSRVPKLSKAKTQEMVVDLCEAVATVHNRQEAARLLTDLLGQQELEMLAKRLRVAELLLENRSYEDIESDLRVSPTTIARIQAWLQESGEGYRMIVEQTKKSRADRERNEKPFKLSYVKKRYMIYYWPQVMLEYWVKNSTQKEKLEMQNILAKLGGKKQMYKQLDLLLKQSKQLTQK